MPCAGDENSDGTVPCTACISQVGCAIDGTTCSNVAGLEDKLICEQGTYASMNRMELSAGAGVRAYKGPGLLSNPMAFINMDHTPAQFS
eukprot:COSAG02_NODE_13728_length_1356_cov_9.636436_1_plen_88_part_10